MQSCTSLCLVIFAATIGVSYCGLLDPNVFQSLSKMPMPKVGNHFDSEFVFDTSKNTLVEALSTNATFDDAISMKRLKLQIPIAQVIMTGNFFSSLTMKRNGTVVLSQNNTGTYLLLMDNVDLSFEIEFEFTNNGLVLKVAHCDPVISDVHMIVKENAEEERSNSLNIRTIRDLIEGVAKQEYMDMFCIAMHGVAARGLSTRLGGVIFDRLTSITGLDLSK